MGSFYVLDELKLFIGTLFVKLERLIWVTIASGFGGLHRFPTGALTRRKRERGRLTSLIWTLGTQARQFEGKRNFDSFGRLESSFLLMHFTKWSLTFSLVTIGTLRE